MAMGDRRSGSGADRTTTFLALLGFVPFAFLTALILADPGVLPLRSQDGGYGGSIVIALKVYAAIVLSFICGIRWGVAVVGNEGGKGEAEALVLGAGLSLIGWFAFFMGEPWSFAVFAAAFATAGWWDYIAIASEKIPEWFGRLRMLLTALVVITMIAAFVATW